MTDPVYYVNGEYVTAGRAALPLNDLGIVRGYGVFDLLRTYNRVPFRLRDHVLRLENSARLIGLALPWSTAQLEAVARETYQRNDIENATIRMIVTGGPSGNFMTPQNKPSLLVMVNPIAPSSPDPYIRGARAMTTIIERIMPTVKSLNYIGAIMAVADASQAGAIEALYLDQNEHVTEGTRTNLFLFRDHCLVTPKDGVLKGITRQVVLELARDQVEVVEMPIHYRDLMSAEEAFITSTTKEILPIIQIDNLQIGSGAPGPGTRRLMELFRTYVQTTCEITAA